jgi:hypothetical protein
MTLCSLILNTKFFVIILHGELATLYTKVYCVEIVFHLEGV